MKKERYRRGAHTVTDFQYHFVWKTKYGYKVLKDEIGLRLRSIIREICSEHEMDVVKGNIRANHIHILVRGPSHLSPAKILQSEGEELISATQGVPAVAEAVLGPASLVTRVLWRDSRYCNRGAD
jgi:hypothetical protein